MGNHDYRDEEDRVMTVRAEIDEARRRGKRKFLRHLPASKFTVDDIALLLDNGSVYQQRLGCHALTEYHEREFDRMMAAAYDRDPVVTTRVWPRDLDLSEWEVRTRHRREPCNGGRCSDSCSNCNLFICAICGGSEGSLLPFCPDRRLKPEEDERNYAHYCAGTGPFAKATSDNVRDALGACGDYCRTPEGDVRGDAPGSTALYEAVRQLLYWIDSL